MGDGGARVMVSGGYRLHRILHGGSSLSLESEISPSPSSPSGNHLIVVLSFSLHISPYLSLLSLKIDRNNSTRVERHSSQAGVSMMTDRRILMSTRGTREAEGNCRCCPTSPINDTN